MKLIKKIETKSVSSIKVKRPIIMLWEGRREREGERETERERQEKGGIQPGQDFGYF
jgi:hypothetical protein